MKAKQLIKNIEMLLYCNNVLFVALWFWWELFWSGFNGYSYLWAQQKGPQRRQVWQPMDEV